MLSRSIGPPPLIPHIDIRAQLVIPRGLRRGLAHSRWLFRSALVTQQRAILSRGPGIAASNCLMCRESSIERERRRFARPRGGAILAEHRGCQEMIARHEIDCVYPVLVHIPRLAWLFVICTQLSGRPRDHHAPAVIAVV